MYNYKTIFLNPRVKTGKNKVIGCFLEKCFDKSDLYVYDNIINTIISSLVLCNIQFYFIFNTKIAMDVVLSLDKLNKFLCYFIAIKTILNI